MRQADDNLRRLRQRLGVTMWLRQAVWVTAGYLLAWGVVVVIARGAADADRGLLAWGLIGVPLAIAAAGVWIQRKLPDLATLRAVIDRQSGAGGLVMAEAETGLGDWESNVPQLRAPRLRWRGGRGWGMCGLAGVFAAAAFLVPHWFVAAAAPRPLDISREADQLSEQIAALEEQQLLDKSEIEAMELKLEQLREQAAGEDPVKTWEALDHLDRSVKQTAEQAAEDALSEVEKIAPAEALAKALDAEGESFDPRQLAEAMEDLENMMGEAAADSPALQEALPDELLEALRQGEFDPAQLTQAAEAMQLTREQVREMLERLADAELIDAELCKAGEDAGQLDPEGLAAFIAECEGEMSAGQCAAMWRTAMPGEAGINRGRGDAELTFGDESDETGVKFTERSLPAASLEAMKESKLVAVTAGAPEVDADAGPSEGGALTGAAGGGGGAYTRTVLPRHRSAVRRYFERSDQSP